MNRIFKSGDTKTYSFIVKDQDVAAFNGKSVHPVCATFTLAREIEWSTRLFVLDMLEEDEEGIGTLLEIEHRGPAFVGEEVIIRATVISFEGHELICSYVAATKKRRVAEGRTGQKILKKEKLEHIFREIRE